MSDRMTPLDAAFYHLERTGQLLHVGSVCMFGGPLDYERTVADLAARLHLVPRYTQRVMPVPLNLGNPTWEPARGFDIRQHVVRHVLRPPGDDEQLRNLVSRLFAEPLDRSRPLWELHQIDGWRDDRGVLLAKVHHCMIDGVSGVQLLGVLFDVTALPAPSPPAPEPPPPSPPPTPSEQAWQAVAEGAASAAEGLRVLRGLLRRPRDAWQEARAALEVLGGGARMMLESIPPTPFNGFVGTLRRLEWLTLDLHEVKRVKNRLGGTVNDVVLATITGGLRRYLEHRGYTADRVELRAMCPVSVRTANERLQLGNRVSAMIAPLPVGIFDPLERLRQIRTAMEQLKGRGESQRMGRLIELLGYLPAPLQPQMGWLQSTPVNTICTNVPGPPVSLFFQGLRLERMVPLVPLAQGVGLTFAILSYADTLTIGVNLDPALIRDGDRIVKELDASFAELRTLAGVEPGTPARPARPRRRPSASSRVA